MSTFDYVGQAVADDRLVQLQLTLPVGTLRRAIFAPPELHEQLIGEDAWPLAYPQEILLADLDRFMLGQRLTFATGRERTCILKILDPWTDEVWEIRSRGEKPGARLLGRFAQPNCFVALCLEDRHDLDFNKAIRRTKAEWRKIFGPFQPFSGLSPSDYITSGLVDLRTGS